MINVPLGDKNISGFDRGVSRTGQLAECQCGNHVQCSLFVIRVNDEKCVICKLPN